MASLSSMLGGIKSVQRGVTSAPDGEVTVNISPVNPAKAFVNISSYANKTGDSLWYIRLTSSTTLVASGKPNSPISWEVVEFY